MKSRLYVQTCLSAAAALIALSLSAEPVDHSTMHHSTTPHNEHGDMLQQSPVSEHQGHDDMMMQEDPEHHMHGQPEGMLHSEQHTKSSGMDIAPLSKLSTMPPSGTSREAGFDGRYAMESTSAQASTAIQCAQGSRGLLMVDNATWAKCGGKPQGWPKGMGDDSAGVSADVSKNASTMDHGEHMGR